MRQMVRGTVLFTCVLALVAPALGAEDDDLRSFFSLQQTMEETLLQDALARYQRVRSRQQQAESRAGDLAERLDLLLAGDGTSLASLEDLDTALSLATHTAHEAADQARELRGAILEHRRRIALLAELVATAPEPGATDPLSGTWVVRVIPSGQQGVFELRLDGTLVSGSYRLDGGYWGSLRGTFVANTLRLERVDAHNGFDIVYEGEYDPGAGRIQGSWQRTLLNAPGPAGGDFVARKATPVPRSP